MFHDIIILVLRGGEGGGGTAVSFWYPVLGGPPSAWSKIELVPGTKCGGHIFISLSTMVLKILILMFYDINTLMQPKNKKRKVTKMNNYSWINMCNDTSSWVQLFY